VLTPFPLFASGDARLPGVHRDARVRLRPATADDLDALAPLAGARDRARMRLQAALRGVETLLVVEQGEEALGAVSVRWQGGCDAPNPWLYGLHVHIAARRQGLGGLLVTGAEDVARTRGATAMTLDVDRDDHDVIGFYERRGYHRLRPHQHVWTSVHPETGQILATGTADTWILRHDLVGRHPGEQGDGEAE
jgi:ribosomal protein S18 acetylase RimI-like enzyme